MSERKLDHITLASQLKTQSPESSHTHFNYEPLYAAHPLENKSFDFLGYKLAAPFWVSSMTGGVELGGKINQVIAKVCGQYKIPFALGSCRSLLTSDARLADFKFRAYLKDVPFYGNLGIAQVEQLLAAGKVSLLETLVSKLELDGIVIHINPMQEWFQPEGDRLQVPALETLTRLLDQSEIKFIVKEVGQGFGPKSLKTLMNLPLTAIEFGALGGTNFSLIELARQAGLSPIKENVLKEFAGIGHSASDMVTMVNQELKNGSVRCQNFIIAGGVSSVLQGLGLVKKLQGTSVFGQALPVMEYALKGEQDLAEYFEAIIQAWNLSEAFFELKDK
jgi:isopentenyl-diphosphate delta-isomerase